MRFVDEAGLIIRGKEFHSLESTYEYDHFDHFWCGFGT